MTKMNFNFAEIDWGALVQVGSLTIIKLVAIVIIFLIVKSIGSKLITKSFHQVADKQQLSSGRAKTLEKLSINIFSYILMFIVIVMIFEMFGYNPTALLAGAGVIGLAIGFGAQGLVSDVVTGFFLLLEKQFDVDDYITAAGFSGIVEEIGLRTTKVRGFDGTLHYIPNREISSLSNHSRGNMRALVDISISYNDDIDKAIAILQQACDKVAAENEHIKDGPNVVGIQALGASDVVIRVIAKTDNLQQWAVERQLRKELKEALDANGIEIPFPHQVLIEKKENK
jgi:small-conductance mechanosensitive channel